MRRRRKERLFVAAVVFLWAGVCVSCKGGAGLSVVPLGVTPDFAPDTPNVSSLYVSLQKSAVIGERITLDAVVTEVSEPVSGIALKVTYPGAIAKFNRCLEGDLFASTNPCFFSEPPLGSGEVFVGRSITAPESPVPVSGSRTIVRLEFIVFNPGAGDIVFEAQNLGGGDASALLDANGDPILVKWFAGSLSGR